MNTKVDLVFCGNTSIDSIISEAGKKNVIGGSACNSALAAALKTKKQISLVSSLGYDFPIPQLEKFNIDMKYAHIDYHKPSNAFIIDEIQNSISLAQSHFLPIHIWELGRNI